MLKKGFVLFSLFALCILCIVAAISCSNSQGSLQSVPPLSATDILNQYHAHKKSLKDISCNIEFVQQIVHLDGSSTGLNDTTGTLISISSSNRWLENLTDRSGNTYVGLGIGVVTYWNYDSLGWFKDSGGSVKDDVADPVLIGIDTIDGHLTYHLRGAPIISQQGVDKTSSNYGVVDLWIRTDNFYIQKFHGTLTDTGVQQLGDLSGSLDETETCTQWNSGIEIPLPPDLPQ